MGVFAYYDAETDGTVYHVIPSPDSNYAPSTLYSETDSSISGTTIQSDDLPGYFILHHGHQQPASDNVLKWFPPDNLQRHVLRYTVTKAIFGGDYVGPVKEMLSPIQGRKRQVLELGTKTGTWVQAMAAEFPHVQFRSVDIVPVVPHVPSQNITFEVYDFMDGILLEDESQDAVFLKVITEMARDYRALVREVYRVLRPGGLIYIHEFAPYFWDAENPDILAQRSNPRSCHLFETIHRCMSVAGIDPDTCSKLPQWLSPESDLWNKDQKGFKEIHSVIRTSPVYPHDGFPCAERLGPSISHYVRLLHVMSTHETFSLLKDLGMEDEEAKRLIDGVVEETTRHEGCALVKTYQIHAIKM